MDFLEVLVSWTDHALGFIARAWEWIVGANNFWSAFFAAGFGALIAFEVERRRKRRERLSEQCAKANRLISTLGHMLMILEDLQDCLFNQPDEQLGRKAECHEIGGVPGTPSSAPQVAFAEFDFLLETSDPDDQAPAVLGRIGLAERRLNTVLALVNLRTEVFYKFADSDAMATLSLGTQGAADQFAAETLGKRLAGTTEALREDIPEAIDTFKQVILQLRTLLGIRYPGRQFVNLFPTDPQASPM